MCFWKLDVSDDGFLSLIADDGTTKDDVRVPTGEVGDKIEQLFKVEEKDTSEFKPVLSSCRSNLPIGNANIYTLSIRRYSPHCYG